MLNLASRTAPGWIERTLASMDEVFVQVVRGTVGEQASEAAEAALHGEADEAALKEVS